jgi:uncharacterized protein
MDALRKKLTSSPTVARVAPFFIFILLTFFQGKLGPESAYWVYAAKTVAGIWMIWAVWPAVEEMRWKVSVEGIVVGLAVFGIWVGLDPFYPKFGGGGEPWNPRAVFGESAVWAWVFIVVRLLGSTLVVPPLEEVFYRSFLYRYIANSDFQSVPLGLFRWGPFLITSVIFGFVHHQWLAGILCGFAYQGLVCWKKRLGDAMTAHAVTNFCLGLWVVWRDEWHFW